ncbi:MAG: DUF1592 domain-containing protein [Gemmataceae bacterium]|nr:DUF1592 domain-containing protein [Gemmataceae bacterium]
MPLAPVKKIELLRPLLLAALLAFTSQAFAGDEPPANFKNDVLPVFKKNCIGCHNNDKKRGGVTLEGFNSLEDVKKNIKLWERVADKLRTGEMPPPEKPRPTTAQLEVVNRWLDAQVFEFSCKGEKNPGRVTLRRLNRLEYNNTVRDLLGVTFLPAEEFPADDVGYGFDHIGDVLTLPPILLEKYLDAAEDIVSALFKNRFNLTRYLKVPAPDKVTIKDYPEILGTLATKAYRRPATPAEVKKLSAMAESVVKGGEPVVEGLKAGIQAVLVSPHFLFHVEIDPDTSSTKPHPINQFELASRLSYFLWSSLPDETLFNLAKENKLRQTGVIEAEVARLLKDARAKSFTRNFTEQWLQLRNLKTVQPDRARFPSFNDQLRDDMATESVMYFSHITKENRSILEFVDSNYTFANNRLARHYGIPNVSSSDFIKVEFKDNKRGGVITQAGVLTITSNPTRTSPVKRGKWILENILGTPPPPPPPGVDELKEDEKALTGTLRQRMEQHRANPNCATCHQRMDAMGFGLENFNPVGAWREMDGQHPIDAAGELAGSGKFASPRELRQLLVGKSQLFARCFTEKMLIYATGRGMERADQCIIDAIVENIRKDNFKMQALLVEVVKSDTFQMRKANRGGKGP